MRWRKTSEIISTTLPLTVEKIFSELVPVHRVKHQNKDALGFPKSNALSSLRHCPLNHPDL